MPERDLIKNSNILISSLNDSVRATGDVLSVSAVKLQTYKIDTVIADVDYFDKYTELISASGNETPFNRTAAISLDGLFVPYTTYTSYSGELPRFENPSGYVIAPTNKHLNPFNPNNMFGTGKKNVLPSDSGTFNSNVWASGGHNILAAMVASSGDTDQMIESGARPASNYFDADYYYRHKTEINDIKSVAHRLPIMAAGWSYDINNLPVPTLGTGIHPQALWKTELWKVGPIDLRWDNHRKNYTTDGVHMGFCAEDFAAPADVIHPEEGFVYTYDPRSSATPSGEIVSKVTCRLYDVSAGPIDSGTLVYYRYVNGDYHIIYSSCAPDTSIQPLIDRFNSQ